jgi:hypothetical protein
MIHAGEKDLYMGKKMQISYTKSNTYDIQTNTSGTRQAGNERGH